jgi:NAD(P)-dependent dehydrogenase (short-subunit alcohol dehydrogenase family)
MDSMTWADRNVPDLTGKTFVVTGASAGLGASATRMFARRGAKVVMAVRTVSKGEGVANTIRSQESGAQLEVRALELTSLASIRAFAKGVNDELGRIDVLLNNAGVMAPPRSETEDGFELQIGTNHLGHFALTGLLEPSLLASPEGGRVVNVSSMAALSGKLDLDDLMGERDYNRIAAYSQSKLANLLFTFEHQRRAIAAGQPLTVVAAHPGLAATDLVSSVKLPALIDPIGQALTKLFAQPAAVGALALVLAATQQEMPAASYWGPTGFREMRGAPGPAKVPGRAQDEASAAALWSRSEELTGVSWPNPAG